MKPIFKNVTKYSNKSYKEFVNFHNKKYGATYTFFTVLFTILLLYCLILSIKEKQIHMVLIFILTIVFLLFWRIYMPLDKYRKELNNNSKKGKSEVFVFRFFDKYFKINKSKIYYFRLYKVFETEKFFYLYLNKEYAAVVNKTGFEIGNVNDFSEFIKKKCMLRYSKEID